MKKIAVLFVFICFLVNAQNKQILYNFAELPQTLLLNPAGNVNYKYHLGVPLLSGISTEFGSTGFTLRDIFADNNISINDKISNVLNNLNLRDFTFFNAQIEVLNAGYRFDENTYFSFGFYQEIDAISYFPRDVITLLTEGNASYLNRSFSFSQINYNIDVLGVLHFGISRKINEKLQIGGRFKLYSSALNMQSKNNTGTFTTVQGTNNIYRHFLRDIDVDFKTSGLVENDEIIDKPSTYLKNTFFGANSGVGLDFGVVYKMNSHLEFTASIIDFGFIRHKKNIKNTTAKGDFTFDGVNFLYDSNNPNYWQDLDNAFEQQLPTDDNDEAYTTWRPTKINSSLTYSFGERRSKYCYDNTYKDFFTDAVGVQLYSVFRPLSPQLAITGFYQKSFSDKLHAKITYTADDFSLYNIGIGVSAQIWKVNFYGMIDNITQLGNVSAANNLSLQIGANIIVN